jgi:uncharacterized RDD family membrane protein YckC
MSDGETKSTDWGRRMGAALVDVVVQGAVFGTALVIASVLFVIGGALPITAGALLIIAGFAAAVLYGPALMSRSGDHNGQTLGKQTVELKVVRDDGQRVGFGLAVVREVVFKILFGVMITGGLFLLVDALWPLFERRGLAVHDIATQTRVVEAVARDAAVPAG